MAQPRPSCTLILDIDEKLATETTRLEVKRCYSYVGTALVRTHPSSDDGTQTNVMRLLAKLGSRHYLRSSEAGADELWNSTIERWFYNQFHTVSNNMRIYNRRQREIGNTELRFDWIECDMENGALRVAMRLDSTCSVPPEKASILTQVRDALNAGTLGEDVVRIAMPSASSWEEQLEAGRAAAEARAAEEEAAAQAALAAEKEARAQAEAEAAEDFLESPELTQKAQQEAAEEQSEQDASEQKPEEENDPFAEEVPDFAVDYRMWEVEYANGAVRVFDSEQNCFSDEEAHQ